jgi:uncharacterized membrane protein
MQLTPELLSPGLLRILWGLAVAVLVLSFSYAALAGLRQSPARQHLVLGSTVALIVLWSVRATVDPGVGLHVLGMTAAVLMLGWRFAVWAGLAAELAVSFAGTPSLGMVGPNWLLAAVIPATVTAIVARAVRHRLPANLFIFIFAVCFFGAGGAVLSTHLVVAGLLGVSGVPGIQGSGESLLAFLPLVVFPEAFINGAVMSLLVVFRPEWVRLFDDRWYLDGR